jgi:hypothetical protein
MNSFLNPLPKLPRQPVIVSYGGGVNSTALLIGLVERHESVDAITFADTGGEKPETYEFVKTFSAWLVSRNMPPIVTVQNDGKYKTLENNCLQQAMLPSIAYGRRACSDKYKQRPQHKWARQQPIFRNWWEATTRGVIKMIGYGADESHRANVRGDRFYDYEYPLIGWGWNRAVCTEAIRRHGLPQPVKSACFFCPSSTKSEVIQLGRLHPELFDRAVKMEQTAKPNLSTVKGLGRRWSWEKLMAHDRSQMEMFPEPEPISCICIAPIEEDDFENAELEDAEQENYEG